MRLSLFSHADRRLHVYAAHTHDSMRARGYTVVHAWRVRGDRERPSFGFGAVRYGGDGLQILRDSPWSLLEFD